jgi:hypothetical protein
MELVDDPFIPAAEDDHEVLDGNSPVPMSGSG